MQHERIGDWMQTYTGRAYWPMSPNAADVHLADIAHALSMLCRYGGHTRRFYSVAEHSVLVSMVVPSEFALQGLMHDATEAYVSDVIRPLKQNLSNYAEIEQLNWLAIAERFGLPFTLAPEVKHADNAVLLAERDALLDTPPIAWDWARDLKPARVPIKGYTPTVAEFAFLKRFEQLTRGR